MRIAELTQADAAKTAKIRELEEKVMSAETGRIAADGKAAALEARLASAASAAALATDAGTFDTEVVSFPGVKHDLHLYRAIIAGRPIGLAHPQSPAARALADVARLLLQDLQEAGRG